MINIGLSLRISKFWVIFAEYGFSMKNIGYFCRIWVNYENIGLSLQNMGDIFWVIVAEYGLGAQNIELFLQQIILWV